MSKDTSANLDPDEKLSDGQTSEHPSGSPRVPRFVEEPETEGAGVGANVAGATGRAGTPPLLPRVAHAAGFPEDRPSDQ